MNQLENDINDKLRQLLEMEELEEMNVTGNLDGGEGPPKTPGAFKKSDGTDDEDEPDHDAVEVFDYKKTKNPKLNTESSMYKKMISQMHITEGTYRDYKADDSMSNKQKVNKAISEINRKLYEVEHIMRQNVKLKTEAGVDNGQYWKSTKSKLGKISERLLRVAKSFRDLSS
jgi:hypothetical protein